MAIDEETRLDLRREFERLLGPELADAAMEAMPNLDYTDLAARADVNNLRIELRGEMAELRGEMAALGGDLRGEMATNLRTMVLTQLGTSVALAGFVAGFA